MAEAKTQPEQAYHFFASTAFVWAVAPTRREALAKVAQHSLDAVGYRRQVKLHGGLYVWTCKVLTPQDQPYDIENYSPSFLTLDGKSTGVRVPRSDAVEFRIVSRHGHVVPED